MARGRLRVYLGAAPGVGKTFAALEELHELAATGADVVVGYLEDHGRADTAALAVGLEMVPRRLVEYRGRTFEEMDLPALLARAPQVALVDELAHTNVPGSDRPKRWQDVEILLEAGIDVISTVNIQHLESLNDVVEEITGVVQREVIPDDVVRRADEIELVDLTQEAIRQRMSAGKIYPADRIDAALANFFRPGNLGAIRELALSWTADRVDEAVDRYRRAHGIDDQWETRERVVVGITGEAGGDIAIRRAARMAMRSRGQLLGVHVRASDGLATGETDHLERQRDLLSELGGTYHEMAGTDVGDALVEFATAGNATQLVVGATRHSRWVRLIRGSVIEDILNRAGPLDVHVISDPGRPTAPVRRRGRTPALPRRRRVLGWLTAALGFLLATPPMLGARGTVDVEIVLFVYLLVAGLAAWIGGLGPALAAAITGFALGNYLFTRPYETWNIDSLRDLFALATFLVVAGAIGSLVGATARRSAQVRRIRAEAETLAALATAAETDTVDQLLRRLQASLEIEGVALFRTREGGWDRIGAAGERSPAEPSEGDRTLAFEGGVLALVAAPLTADEERLLGAFAAQISASMHRDRLREEAAEMEALSRADELRTALLRAVSHDLRSPLSAIKASVSSLLQDDIVWSPEQTREFLDATYAATDRMDHVVGDLLDASRIQAGAVSPRLREIGLEEVVASAVVGIEDQRRRLVVDVDEHLPRVLTDPGLLERAIENLVRNALQHSPPDSAVRLDAGRVGDSLHLRIIDHGPGVPPSERERIFHPFRGLDGEGAGRTGLGLSVAGGLCEAMAHDLVLEETQGGGTTVVMTLGLAAAAGAGMDPDQVETR